ncbi:MAG: nucleotide-binding protein [Actinobacteria bacterium]|nr:nucleotide-binding protein [Actinomycetota bacterium]
MGSRHRAIVLDANILIRLVLGQRVRQLVLDHADRVGFFTPDVAYADARTYLPGILLKRGVDPDSAMSVLDGFESIVRSVEADVYRRARRAALARIEMRDPADWPVVATALVLGCPIWTEDQDFFGTGVPTWTTDRVLLYLDTSDQS